jgi:hypothetical protein
VRTSRVGTEPGWDAARLSTSSWACTASARDEDDEAEPAAAAALSECGCWCAANKGERYTSTP